MQILTFTNAVSFFKGISHLDIILFFCSFIKPFDTEKKKSWPSWLSWMRVRLVIRRLQVRALQHPYMEILS